MKLSKEEKEMRDSAYISEIPEGGEGEIKHEGKTLVRRKGEEEIERIEEK